MWLCFGSPTVRNIEQLLRLLLRACYHHSTAIVPAAADFVGRKQVLVDIDTDVDTRYHHLMYFCANFVQ